MSKKRHPCTGKRRHKTHGAARHEMDAALKDPRVILHIYRCPKCGFFHVGHPHKFIQRRLRFNRLLAAIDHANRQ